MTFHEKLNQEFDLNRSEVVLDDRCHERAFLGKTEELFKLHDKAELGRHREVTTRGFARHGVRTQLVDYLNDFTDSFVKFLLFGHLRLVQLLV